MGVHQSREQAKLIAKQEKIIEDMRKELRNHRLMVANNAPAPTPAQVSRAKILECIDKQLDDPNNNITLMPDCIERQLKAQIFTMFLNLLDELLLTTRMELMGHEFSPTMKPIDTPAMEEEK